MPIDRRLLANAIGARLVSVTHAAGYYADVGRPLPGKTIGTEPGQTPANPAPKSPSDLRVQPYFILWPGAGAPGPEVDLGHTLDDLAVTVQVTAAGGVADDVLSLVDRLHAVLFRWAPQLDGVVCSPLRYPPGWNPGPLRVDRAFTPYRFFVPLQYQLTATT